MKLLTEASRQLFSRPDDEHFASQEELHTDAQRALETGREIQSRNMIVTARPEDDPIGPFGLKLDSEKDLIPGHFAMSQLAGLARIPMGTVQRLSPKTAAQAINESLYHVPDGEDEAERSGIMVLTEETPDGVSRVRSITSETYSRVWDIEWIKEVERWLLPMGYIPALPTINTDAQQRNIMKNNKPALFRGDRDSFAFYYTEPDQNGADFGGLRRGYMVWNSEVGHRSMGYTTLLFRDMCSNFLIWDASNVEKKRRIHRGDMQPFFREMRCAMQDLSAELESVELQRLEAAVQASFAGDGSPTDANKGKAANRLTREFRLTKSLANATVEAALLPVNATDKVELSHFAIANGLTWEAKDTAHASKLMELGLVQKDILAAVKL